jgi:hypothetical protein
MLNSPTTITIDGTAHSLARINQDDYGSTFFKKGANYEFTLNIRHTYQGKEGVGQIERHNVELIHLTWDVNGNPVKRTTYHVIMNPRNLDPDSVADDTIGLNAWLTTNVVAICARDN